MARWSSRSSATACWTGTRADSMAMLNVGSLPSKAAAEKKDYSFDWSAELATDGDTISASSWATSAVGLVINAADKPATFDAKTTTVWLNAGSTVAEYTVTNTITTAAGRIHVGT